jgi:excisionase family DNA binding protein
MPPPGPSRFLALAEVAEILSISVSQVYALVRRGELPAIKIGGRGQWRVESTALESYIAEAYRSTRRFIADHPYVGDDDPATGQPDQDEPEREVGPDSDRQVGPDSDRQAGLDSDR